MSERDRYGMDNSELTEAVKAAMKKGKRYVVMTFVEMLIVLLVGVLSGMTLGSVLTHYLDNLEARKKMTETEAVQTAPILVEEISSVTPCPEVEVKVTESVKSVEAESGEN